jgi:TolA-binding protein
LPTELRGGANFVIGLAHQRLGAHEDATLALLWPALVYRTDSRLSRRAALLAAECLVKASQPAEARQMYQELVTRVPRTAEAVTAQSRLNELKE